MDQHLFSTVRALSATDRSSQTDSGTECLEKVNHAGSLALSAASPVPPDASQSKSSKRSGLFPWWAQDLHYDPSVSPRVKRLTPNIQPDGCPPLYAAHGRTVASDRKAVQTPSSLSTIFFLFQMILDISMTLTLLDAQMSDRIVA